MSSQGREYFYFCLSVTVIATFKTCFKQISYFLIILIVIIDLLSVKIGMKFMENTLSEWFTKIYIKQQNQ